MWQIGWFLKFWVKFFVTKLAQIWWRLGYFDNITFQVKTALATFGKIWATFSWSGHTDYIYHFTWSSSSQPCLKICPYGLRGFVCVYPSADPRFESEAHHLSFFQFVLLKFDWQKDENKPKRGWNWALILNVYQREAKKENGQIFFQASQVGRLRVRLGHFKRFHHRGARCEKGPISVCSTSRLQRS